MSRDRPTFAEVGEENIRDRFRPLTYDDIKDDPPVPFPEEEIPYQEEP